MFKVLYYVNQFFGQIGGEDKADIEPSFVEKAVGPAVGIQNIINDISEVYGTIICGDNYFNQNSEKALEYIFKIIKDKNPDIMILGPAFNAGRYGMACGEIAKAVDQALKIPTLTGMYVENPGADVCKSVTIVIKTGQSAAKMKPAVEAMGKMAVKILKGEKIGKPDEDNYIEQGKRLTVFTEKRGSERAVEVLLKRLKNEAFETELPMPSFDRVEPAAPIKDLKNSRIALVTSGGIVPIGNPDRLSSASAQNYCEYDISTKESLKGEYFTIHGGYDPIYANEFPDRIVPLDILREFEKDGTIGKVHDKFYTTTGTGTSVGNAKKFGKEIGAKLKEAGVDGVILTST